MTISKSGCFLLGHKLAPLKKKKGGNEGENVKDNPMRKTEKETQMYRTDFWTLWEKARVG